MQAYDGKSIRTHTWPRPEQMVDGRWKRVWAIKLIEPSNAPLDPDAISSAVTQDVIEFLARDGRLRSLKDELVVSLTFPGPGEVTVALITDQDDWPDELLFASWRMFEAIDRLLGTIETIDGRARNNSGMTRIMVGRELRKQILPIMFLGALVVLGTAVNIVSPLLFKVLVDNAIPTKDLGQVAWLLVGMVFASLLAVVLAALQEYQRANIGEAVSQSLRQSLFNHLIRVSLISLEKVSVGDAVHRITRACGELGDVYVANQLLPVVSNVIMLAGSSAAMASLNWRLALIVLLASPLSYFIVRRIRDYALRVDRKFYDILEMGSRYLHEAFSGIRTIRAFNGEDYEEKRWKNWISEHRRIKAKTEVFHSLVLTLPTDLINNLAIGVVYGYGAYEIINGRLSVGALIAFSVYLPRVYLSSKAILDAHVGTGQARAAAEQIDYLFDLEPECSGMKELPEVNTSGVDVKFENVTFHYDRDNFGLSEVSFKVHAGEFLGIVGPTGGGKSTIIDLLLGFYTPRSGRICIEGVDIRDLRLDSLRQSIGVVPQEVFLWNESILHNIIYPNQVPLERVREVAKMAQLDEFIETLPGKYDTGIGERGLSLSGGEQQRLAICRALLRSPRLLLLDEATSNLDAVTETRIRDAIDNARAGRTIIVVAHRLATVMHADRILVLDRGRIVEVGTPAELIASRASFYKLYEAQRL